MIFPYDMRYIEDSSIGYSVYHLYCVTKGSIFFCVVLLFYASDAFVSENLTSEQSERCSTWASCILIFHVN